MSHEIDIDIYFWVDWVAIRYFRKSYHPNFQDTNIRVNPMTGVWKISYKKLDQLIKNAYLHNYQQRKNDYKGNAKSSYLINLNDLEKII